MGTQVQSRMQNSWHRIGAPLVVLLLTAPAWLPFMRTRTLPCTHDNAFHYFRITAMRDALRHGWLFSRWVPNLALGYGYPFFNYREPLPYLLGEGLFVLGVPLPLVLGLFYAGSIFFAAYGCFVLSRDLFGRKAAWVGAVTYGLAPYVLLDAFRRGNLPESIALALLPWLFIFFRRLIIHGGRSHFLVATALLAGLFLTHNITALLLVPFLGLYVITFTCLYHPDKKWWMAFLAVAFAVMLTAWFWLPALFEQDMVQLTLSHSTRNNDFHYNFISWRQIVWQLPVPYDPAYLNPPMKVTLGLGQWVLAVTGMVTAMVSSRTKEQRSVILLFSAAALGYLWLSTPASVGFWEAIPILSFVQFPWRMVGRALLPVSLLGAAAWADSSHRMHPSASRPHLTKQVWTAIVLCAVLALLILSAYPDTTPPKGWCPVEPTPDIADVTAYEQQGFLGMDPEQSYFPIWVEDHPVETSLAAAFAACVLPDRLERASLPAGATATTVKLRPLRANYEMITPVPFRVRWLGLYFPGWVVTVDGNRIPVIPEDDTGLMTFDLPAGDHRVQIRFGSTPLRSAGGAAAGLAMVGLVVFVWRTFHGNPAVPSSALPGWQLPSVAVAIFSVVLLIMIYGVVDRIPTPLRRSRITESQLPEVTNRLFQPYADHLTLLGVDVSHTQLPGDSELQVDVLWRAEATPGRSYATTVLVIGQDGQSWSPAGTLRPVGYETPPPTTQWDAGEYVYDPHIVSVLPGTPPGTYRLDLMIFDQDTLQPLHLLNGNGSVGAAAYSLGTLKVIRPETPFSLNDAGVGENARPESCGPAQLWQMTLDRESAAPGDIVALRWVWEKIAGQPLANEGTTLSLVDTVGKVAHTWTLPLSADWWPFAEWRGGDIWVGRHVVRLPRNLQGGPYHLQVHLAQCESVLGTAPLTVTELDRSFEIPADITRINADFEGQVSLVGYALADEPRAPGDTLDVRLVWQAQREMDNSYRVYLHLLGEEGIVVDQDDGEPAAWTRPTTGWMVGEVIIETRQLVIPEAMTSAAMTLRVGLYTPDGPRLILPDGSDGVTLPPISVTAE